MNAIQAAFEGRLRQDAELKHVKNGELALVSFSVAVGGRSGGDSMEYGYPCLVMRRRRWYTGLPRARGCTAKESSRLTPGKAGSG